MIMSECHPDRRNYGKGLCKRCYENQYIRRPILKTSSCHPERRLFAKGMCQSCYKKQYKSPTIPSCHSERKHYSHGLCEPCYQANKVNPKRAICHPDREHVCNGLCENCRSVSRRCKIPTKDFIMVTSGLERNCQICKTEEDLNLDHNHKTGKIRGFLCGPCNRGIGLLREDMTILESAVRYLKSHNC